VNRIRLLPEQVANQIAAGEVVERPASVVKELVENSLDAEPTRISVEIGAGGRSLIRVTDDGTGMSRDDALLCLERHATSKIRRAEDLAAIATMGFRGEAIPSIASVSRFTLTTRERDDASGEATQVVINGGKIIEVKAAASPTGTAVEVRQIFFNLPARRKFLRSEETERAHIAHYLTLVALAFPQVGFTFTSDGRQVWQLPPVKWTTGAERLAALRERLRQLHGADVPLLPVEFTAEIEEAPEEVPGSASTFAGRSLADGQSIFGVRTSHFRIWGFIGTPGVSRSTRDEQHLFVNQRPVENRGLNFALLEGYHTALMRGRYPVACLFLELDPAAVDVNVHPQKREVKFREEPAVRRLVAKAVRETLLAFHGSAPATTPVPMPAEGNGVPAMARTPTQRPTSPVPEEAGFRLTPPAPARPAAQTTLPLSLRPAPVSIPLASVPSVPEPEVSPSLAPSPVPDSGSADVPSIAPPSASPARLPVAVPLLHVPLRLVGVVGRLYVVLESDRGLVLLDQHAAHERILFEQMLARIETAQLAPSQRLLLPETVELTPRDADFVRQNLDTLTRLGVGLSEFGDRTFLLDALPPFVKAGNPKQFAFELIDALKSAGAGVNSARLGEDVIAKTVCRHAVKANDPLRGPELENLVNDLRRCTMPYTCPHGRPTLIEMNWRELEKKFGRTG
jgi:DNA mismatch repair protein MutL